MRFGPLRDAAGAILGAVEIASDVAERVRMEQALRESERCWATTLSSIGDAVIATDVSGRITFMNSVAQELTGWSLQDDFQRPVKEVFHIINEHTRAEVTNPVSKVLESGVVVGLANHTVLVRKDGTEIPIADSGAPIRDENGETLGQVDSHQWPRLENEQLGFGLFSIRERVNYLGGVLEVESSPGRGSRVSLSIPFQELDRPISLSDSPYPAQPVQAESERLKAEKQVRYRVLLADDHQVMRQGLIALLDSQPDIQMIGEAADGREALEMARSLDPDVVVMDVMMPGMDGIEGKPPRLCWRRFAGKKPAPDNRTVIRVS